jgi:hypothetical protein
MAHVAAAIRIFEASDRPKDLAKYVDHYRRFKRVEPWAIIASLIETCKLCGESFGLTEGKAGHLVVLDQRDVVETLRFHAAPLTLSVTAASSIRRARET